MRRIIATFPAVLLIGCAPKTSVSSPVPVAPPIAPAPSTPVSISVQARATLNDLTGNRVGTVDFTDTPGGLLVTGTVSGLGLGAHGVHLHAVGKCEPPFTTAGGHFNPTSAKHGFRNPDGHHMGDMPNIVTPAAGQLGFQFVVAGVRLNGNGGLLDADGAAIVIHATADDYMTDPSGNSGSRLACGVIVAR